MRLKAFTVYRKVLLMLTPLMLAACSDDQPPTIETGPYLLNDITIQFPPLFSQTEGYDVRKLQQQQEVHDQLQTQISNSYFTLQPNRLTYYQQGSMLTGMITPENMGLIDLATFHLSLNDNHTIDVTSPDYGQCRTWQCEVSFTLTHVTPDNPMLITLQQQLTENETPRKTSINIDETSLLTEIDTPYWGIYHEISDHLNMKLSAIQSNGLIYGVPGHTKMNAFTLGNIEIDPQAPDVEVLSFYSNDAPSSDVHQIDTISYLFILPLRKDTQGQIIPHLDIPALDADNQRYLSQESGFIAEDTTGYYAVNYFTFPKAERAVIVLTEGLALSKVTQHYRSLQSLSDIPLKDQLALTAPTDTKAKHNIEGDLNNRITLQDIALSLPTLEGRYDITLSEMFRINDITRNYTDKLHTLLKSEDLYLKNGPTTVNGYHLFKMNIGDYRFNDTYLKIHNSSLNNVIQSLQANQNQKGSNPQDSSLWHDPIYIYTTDPQQASGLSYFKELQKGVTLEIFSPATQGHIAEKVLFGKLLSGFDFRNMPKISSVAIPNIAQYTAIDVDEPLDKPQDNTKIYHFVEGDTDLQGRLLKK